jgi:arylsulfatase A-like enzyme
MLALLATLPTAVAAPAARPNVVFIFADDWGWGDLIPTARMFQTLPL